MAQTSILSPGTTPATSGDIVVPAGVVVTVGIYESAPSSVKLASVFTVNQDTPGIDIEIGIISLSNPSIQIIGPGTFRVVRSSGAGGKPLGVFVES